MQTEEQTRSREVTAPRSETGKKGDREEEREKEGGGRKREAQTEMKGDGENVS
jgi:hypothetical protein